MTLYAEALRRHRDELNSLNVYPVPDGDTGTNMLRTQEAVIRALEAERSPGADLAALVAHASLMGARGNSGVILSQVLRGLFEGLPGEHDGDGSGLAEALRVAADGAYRAVAQPAEGTVLTVLRDAAKAATDAAGHAGDETGVMDAAVEEAEAALERTREQLPALRDAGVVDAGGKGIVLLLDALRAAVTGKDLVDRAQDFGPARRSAQGEDVRSVETQDAQLENPFEVQYLLEADDLAISPLRERLAGLGDSLVVVGGDGLFNIHVHTALPGQAVELALAAGRPRDISITWLQGQVADCLGEQARSVRVGEPSACAVVAVAEGPGVMETFRSLGAAVVEGGPGNNPAVADLVAAIEAAPAEGVIVLPNHPNVVPAATRAVELASRAAAVVPTTSIPEGIAAAAAFNPAVALDRNGSAMEEASAACRSGGLARAERDATTPEGPVEIGQWMGLAGDGIAGLGPDASAVAERLVRRLVKGDSEIVTVIEGRGASTDEREAVVAALRAAFPELEVQVIDGGQPRYPFLIGVE
jgi:DAK2 domain fusion protein YloV